MADQNYVEIKIKADDTAKPDLTDLKAKLEDLGSKVETAKVDVDDKQAAAELLALNAKLAALNKQTANPRITVAGAARVEAQLAAIDAGMERLNNLPAQRAAAQAAKEEADAARAAAAEERAASQAERAAAKQAAADAKTAAAEEKRLADEAKKAADAQVGLKSRLLALGGAAGSVTGIGDAMTLASGDANKFQKVMAGAGLATGLLEPVTAGATVAIGGLASGLVAAGAGLGVFGLVAKSNLSAATTAANQVQAAQIAYNAQIANGVKQSKAYQTEQIAISKAYAQMSPAQIAMSKQISNVQNAWQSFVQANTAGVDKVLTQGIGLLPTIFKAIQPLMAPVEKALSGIISSISRAIAPAKQVSGIFKNMALPSGGGGFQSFIKMLADNTGPAITKIATAIGHVAVGLGGILKAFMPMAQTMLSGLDKITKKFADWGSSLTGHSGFQALMSQFKSETPLAMQVLQNLVVVLKNVASAMAGISTGSNSKMLLQMLTPLSGVLVDLSKNTDLVRVALYALAAADTGKKIKGVFDGITNGLTAIKGGMSAFQNLSAGFRNSAAAASEATGVWGTIGGKISSIGSALASAGSSVASFVAGMVKQLAKAAIATGVWIAEHAAATAAFIAENIAQAASAMAAFVAENLATLGIVALIGLLVAAIIYLATHWKQVWGDIKAWALDAWHFLDNNVIHPIASAFSWLAGAVVGFFARMVSGVWNGLGALGRLVSSMPGRILGWLGNLGSLLWNAGAALMRGLINGIESMFGALGHVASSIGSFIANLKGPLPKDLTLLVPHGQAIMTGLMTGMNSKLPALHSTLTGVSNTIQGGVRPGVAGAGAGGGGQIVLRIEGSDASITKALVLALRREIRVQGGNVQAVLGH
jgi:hypothetical protein